MSEDPIFVRLYYLSSEMAAGQLPDLSKTSQPVDNSSPPRLKRWNILRMAT
ncbi:MAG: hypothetical protein KGH87_07380 [Thaumarchaeota archaeon]|nr:hypothetical protein [Nitrososphaerota archaeon]MDE1839724.1 hypothetical protein [Nitrososphaerota archaeon]